MKILTENTNVLPYTTEKHQIISIGGAPVAGSGQAVRDVLNDTYDGSPKIDLYFCVLDDLMKKWTVGEVLANYKNTVHVDIEKKSFEYTSRLDYKLRYYNDIVAKGGSLTTEQAADRVALATESTAVKDYIHGKIQANEMLTTKPEVEAEYLVFLTEYTKKMNELEGVL